MRGGWEHRENLFILFVCLIFLCTLCVQKMYLNSVFFFFLNISVVFPKPVEQSAAGGMVFFVGG